jgi:asparagine synthase (glutamine-hydrolysing)
MCGICGVVDEDGTPDVVLIERMMATLRHRGPDGAGWFRDDRVGLGHVRLSIIDPAGGSQPMADAEERVWITFNGEIFNYVELRQELRERGHRFRTTSDTEVVVAAWLEWGAGCFDRLNGQWALALWDRQRGELVLSRDRFGVRPLYYARVGRRLVFASEVKALFCDQDVPRALDPAGMDETFTYWSPVAPRTAFQGVQQLEPGHFAVWRDGTLRRTPYWQMEFPERGAEPSRDLAKNTILLREKVIEAARLRFERSDVPVGAYLSGGLDSSITAGVLATYTDATLDTFSLRFTDPDLDEGGFQSLMAQRLGTRHHQLMVGPRQIHDVFPEVVRHAETPLLRAAPAAMYLLSQAVREAGYKVVVTGEGADEMLAGYDIFREARVRRFWANEPSSQLRGRSVELLYPWMTRSPTQVPAFAQSFFGQGLDLDDPAASHRPRWNSTSALKSLISPDFKAAGAPGADVVAMLPAASRGWDPLSRAQWLEVTTLLSGYLLSSQGDRMLMANSVEGRFPFLDKDVVELAGSVPSWQKLMGLDEKFLLKRAFADLVPESIVSRPKQPYRTPDAASFFTDVSSSSWLGDVTSPAAVRGAGVFDPERVEALLRKCAARAGTGMSNTDNMRAVAVISTQLVHQLFVAQGPSPAARTDLPPLTVRADYSRAGSDQ